MNYLLQDLIKLVSNPKKFFKTKQILADIEETLNKNFDTDVVVMSKVDFDNITNGKLPAINKKSSTYGYKSDRDLSDTEVIYDYYGTDNYYDDDDLMIMDVGEDSNRFDLKSHSVFNFAIVYLFGNHYSNFVTIFSLDEKGQLFVYDQKQFKLKTHLDVIDACDKTISKYELDTLIFIETDVMKHIYENVVQGLSDSTVTTTLYREFVNFHDTVEDLIPLLNGGDVFVNYGEPWYIHLQNEINRYFTNTTPSPMQKAPSNIILPYPKLKSMVYGVHYWDTYKNTKKLQRDLNAK